jgi:hypothetical protein
LVEDATCVPAPIAATGSPVKTNWPRSTDPFHTRQQDMISTTDVQDQELGAITQGAALLPTHQQRTSAGNVRLLLYGYLAASCGRSAAASFTPLSAIDVRSWSAFLRSFADRIALNAAAVQQWRSGCAGDGGADAGRTVSTEYPVPQRTGRRAEELVALRRDGLAHEPAIDCGVG